MSGPLSNMKAAEAPFNRADRDVALLSSDRILYSCHKNILSIASPFFADLFSLKQQKGQDHDMRLDDGTPVVPITEGSVTLFNLLRILYPVPAPDKYSLSETAELLEAARKYDIEVVRKKMTAGMNRLMQTEALSVFAVACRLGMEAEAKAAAARLLRVKKERIPQFCYNEAMEGVSAWSYLRLLQFLEDNDVDALEAVGSFIHPTRATTGISSEWVSTEELDELHSSWLSTGLFRQHREDMMVRSLRGDSLSFPAHRFILSLASPTFATLVEEAKIASAASPDGEMPLVGLMETPKILHELLRCCYGMVPSNTGEDTIFSLIPIAAKYQLTRALELLRVAMQPFLQSNPLRSYFVAVSLDWKEEIEVAAKHAAKKHTQSSRIYIPEMETSSAAVYYNLLKYQSRVQEVTNNVISRYSSRQLPYNRYSTGLGVPFTSGAAVHGSILNREIAHTSLHALQAESLHLENALAAELEKIQFFA